MWFASVRFANQVEAQVEAAPMHIYNIHAFMMYILEKPCTLFAA